MLFLFAANAVLPQSITIFNASHDYSITEIKFYQYFYGDLIFKDDLKLKKSIPARAGFGFMNISAGYYYLRVKWENGYSKDYPQIKIFKSVKISIGSENEDSEWKE